MKKLTPVHRAFLAGFRAAKRKSQRDLREMAGQLEDLQNVISEIGDDFHRLEAAAEADVERDSVRRIH